MKRSKSKAQKGSVEAKFPNTIARNIADLAIDKLDPKLTMTEYIDAWYMAYVSAGGEVRGIVS